MKTTRTNRIAIGVTALLMTAGLPAALAAQPERESRQVQTDRERATRFFVSSEDLMGADLKNQLDETLGSVDNYIVDRGSGRIVYAIVKSGDFLGIGGKQFALPYDRMSYLPASKSFLSSLTEEQVERQTEFLPENWSDLQHTTWMEKIEGWVSDEDPESREEFRKAAAGKKRTIEGTVAEVNREDFENREATVIRVLGEDGSTHDVVLGPSWYVMGAENTPMRGDPVELTVFECDGKTHAMDAKVRGKTVTYRNDMGDGRWSADEVDTPRYILLSDLIGRPIEMAGTTSGEVQRTLIEARSGRVAFIGMDPNENFLGLGDRITLVPWSVFRVGAESMSLDADNRAVEQGAAWPDDTATLNSGNTISAAYAAFGATEPRFTPRPEGRDAWDDSRDRDPQARRTGDAWSSESPFVRTFAAGEKVTLDGTVEDIGSETLQEGTPEALVMTVKTADGNRRVILGPGWFAGRQNLMLREGDRIRVEGRSATWNGEPWVSAWTVTKGERNWSFWKDSKPVWNDDE